MKKGRVFMRCFCIVCVGGGGGGHCVCKLHPKIMSTQSKYPEFIFFIFTHFPV